MQHPNPNKPQTKAKKSIKKVARTKSVQRHLTTQNPRDLNIFDSMTKQINQVSQNLKKNANHSANSLPLDNQFTANNVMCKNFGFRSNENMMLGLGGLQNQMDSLMGGFSNMKIGMSGGNTGSGNMVCRSYTYNTTIDGNGNKQYEKKFTNQAQARNKHGDLIREKQEMYKNSKTGEKRIGKERTLNDQGRKMVRKKTGSDGEQVFNFYNGLEEDQAEKFNEVWENRARDIGFYGGTGGGLGYKSAAKKICSKANQFCERDTAVPNLSKKFKKSKTAGMHEGTGVCGIDGNLGYQRNPSEATGIMLAIGFGSSPKQVPTGQEKIKPKRASSGVVSRGKSLRDGPTKLGTSSRGQVPAQRVCKATKGNSNSIAIAR
jgi:hypothetical protein